MYFEKDRQIHLVTGITDMRKQINGLAQIANEKKSDRVFSGVRVNFSPSAEV